MSHDAPGARRRADISAIGARELPIFAGSRAPVHRYFVRLPRRTLPVRRNGRNIAGRRPWCSPRIKSRRRAVARPPGSGSCATWCSPRIKSRRRAVTGRRTGTGRR